MLGTAERIRQEGFEQGIECGRIETAKNFLAKNLDIELVSECSGLPIEKVKELAIDL